MVNTRVVSQREIHPLSEEVKGREKHPFRQIVNVREIAYDRSWLIRGVLARGKPNLSARKLRGGKTPFHNRLLT